MIVCTYIWRYSLYSTCRNAENGSGAFHEGYPQAQSMILGVLLGDVY